MEGNAFDWGIYLSCSVEVTAVSLNRTFLETSVYAGGVERGLCLASGVDFQIGRMVPFTL
jgi:hypothetical protein